MDPRKVNGGVFLGLDGIVIKSHGGTDATGFAAAIEIAYDMVEHDLMAKIRDSLEANFPAPRQARPKPEPETHRDEVSVPSSSAAATICPSGSLTNDELARIVDTTNEWIVERTGIRQRHIAPTAETTSVLATYAARAALARCRRRRSTIDLIIVATATPDHTFPATATQVQSALGITTGVAFDLQAVCSGFVFALTTADSS